MADFINIFVLVATIVATVLVAFVVYLNIRDNRRKSYDEFIETRRKRRN